MTEPSTGRARRTRPLVVAGVAVAVAVSGLAVVSIVDGRHGGADREMAVVANQQALWSRYASGTSGHAHMVHCNSVAEESPGEESPGEDCVLVAMIDHHLDAIDGAERFLDATADSHQDPTMVATREFAQRIVRVQAGQVDQMDTMIADWYPAARPSSTYEPMFGDASTIESPVAFLTTMIEHHEMALTMYVEFIVAGGVVHDEVGLLLARIGHGQEGEIATMRQFGG